MSLRNPSLLQLFAHREQYAEQNGNCQGKEYHFPQGGLAGGQFCGLLCQPCFHGGCPGIVQP